MNNEQLSAGDSTSTAQPIIHYSLNNCSLFSELEELKVGDLACGSGHILNECFDLLYDLYIAEGYGRGEAIENIFRHNLTGIDLDTRAKQLATFALLLKACQKDNAFADGHCLPNVLDMPEPYDAEAVCCNLDSACLKFLGGYENVAAEMLEEDMELLMDADNLGSIMKFNDDEIYLAMLRHYYDDWTSGGTDDCPEEIQALIPGVRVILALTEKYHALVMNPPYMGGGNMNATLSKYVKDEYEEGKADLFSVFMLLAIDRLLPNGKYGMINMQSWMFLSSFEKLRTRLLEENRIDNMLHLGPRTFDELSGEVVQNTAFVITNCEGTHAAGSYYRLIEGKNCGDKERMFLEAQENGGKAIINYSLSIIHYKNVSQQDFEKLPGCPIGYWVSDKVKEIFTSNLALSAVASPCVGLQTADNARFLRLWSEVSQSRIGFGCENAAVAARSQKKWFPYNKGGNQRRWYGNQTHLVNWENDGQEIKAFSGAVVRNPSYYFKPSLSWSDISSSSTSFKVYPKGFIFDVCGMSCFDIPDLNNLLGVLNTKLFPYLIRILNPTMHFQIGNFKQLPFLKVESNDFNYIVQRNISISKQDWDAHETSWDFETNPLLDIMNNDIMNNEQLSDNESADDAQPIIHSSLHNYSLSSLMEQYKRKWEHLFMQLHANEEELNRQFIDIYGLQDELTPDVPLDEITILQQGEVTFDL